MTHFLSCVIVLTVTKIARIPPAFVYELFQSCHKLSFLRGNRTLNRNRDFKAALFQVASSVGFLSHFSRNFPSMFYKEAKSGREFDWDVSDIYLLIIRVMYTLNSHRTRIVLVVFFMTYNKTFADRNIFPVFFGNVVPSHTASKFKCFLGFLSSHTYIKVLLQ